MRFGIGFANVGPVGQPDPLDGLVELTTMLSGPHDVVRRMQDLGVSRLVMAPPAFDAEGLARSLGEFADRIIAEG